MWKCGYKYLRCEKLLKICQIVPTLQIREHLVNILFFSAVSCSFMNASIHFLWTPNYAMTEYRVILLTANFSICPAVRKRTNAPSAWEEKLHRCKGDPPPGRTSCLPPRRTSHACHACRKARNVKRTIRTSHACRKARNVKRTIRTSHACRKARNVKRTIRTSHACRKARNVKRTIRTSHACRKARNVKRTIRTSHACRKARNVKRTIRTSHASSCRKGSQSSHDDSET